MKTLNLDWQETTDILRKDTASILYPVDKAGVYLYTSYDRKQMVYVGKGDPMEQRFKEHKDNRKSNPELYDYLHRNSARLYYAEIGKEEDRKSVELYLFKLLNPLFNKNSPEEVEIISVNLPELLHG